MVGVQRVLEKLDSFSPPRAAVQRDRSDIKVDVMATDNHWADAISAEAALEMLRAVGALG